MICLIVEDEKTAVEALRRLYISGMQACQVRRMAEIKRITETRIAAQVTAQTVYDETVRQADADLEATIGEAKAVYDAAFNPLRETFEQKTGAIKAECKAAQQAADAEYAAARAAIDEAYKLAESMAEEIYAVEQEAIADYDSPEYELATRKYESGVADAAKVRDAAVRAADEVRRNLHRTANEQHQLLEQPARAEFDAGYKLIQDVFAPISKPAQLTHNVAKRHAWDALEAGRKAANEAETVALQDLDLQYDAERRTRVMLWKEMEAQLKRFSSVYS
jgi:hypothetical protein